MSENSFTMEAVGMVRSELVDTANAPRQGDEGGFEAWLEFTPAVAEALVGIRMGDSLILMTWLHQARRDVLQVHPRGNPANPLLGVFATRSSHRPNPIGLHRVEVLEVEWLRLRVAPLEAIDGTPIIDVKVALREIDER
jgi:tRNA-Thr(GGU) m(6)t(6)A37 methyltransferase TsaA